MNNLLYYVARAQSAGPRIKSVRESFRLDEVLAAGGPGSETTETLSAPSVRRLMKTVAAAIREDLTRVKDVLDIFVSKGASQVDDLVRMRLADDPTLISLGRLPLDTISASFGTFLFQLPPQLIGKSAYATFKLDDGGNGLEGQLLLDNVSFDNGPVITDDSGDFRVEDLIADLDGGLRPA